MKFIILFLIFLTGCSTAPEYIYTPYKTFYSQPPGEPKTWPQPIQLKDIDNSDIYVFTNGDYWYSGPRVMNTKGWIPLANGRPGWYPLPGEVWEMEVCFVEKN